MTTFFVIARKNFNFFVAIHLSLIMDCFAFARNDDNGNGLLRSARNDGCFNNKRQFIFYVFYKLPFLFLFLFLFSFSSFIYFSFYLFFPLSLFFPFSLSFSTMRHLMSLLLLLVHLPSSLLSH